MLTTVQELCRSFYGVTAVTAESYGCVWHFQQRYAGHDVLEVSLESQRARPLGQRPTRFHPNLGENAL